nr:hypothetical protein L203_03366 [Cryptococcus depauperatus CBS 7841]
MARIRQEPSLESPAARDMARSLYDSSPLASAESSPMAQAAVPAPAEDDDQDNIFREMSFDEILEDLNARFLINLPKEEMSLLRVYWQAEQAHWFYEDYLRPLNPVLPSLSQRHFTRLIIESSPLYRQLISSSDGGVDHNTVWDEYRSYKRMVPCCGGILLNKEADKVLLVRGWKSNAGWSFPRGKINAQESEEACAIREVEEETGFDLTGLINAEDRIKTHINAQEVTMFIVANIDEATEFETQTRHEIGAIEWVPLTDLPTWSNNRKKKSKTKRFYNVTPFVNPLKLWMKEHDRSPYPKPRLAKTAPSQVQSQGQGFHRSLQPFDFTSFSPSNSPVVHTPSSSHLPSRGTSALDQLFTKFIHKQEEELTTLSADAMGSDNNAGLTRLFGNLNVLKEEEDALAKKEQEREEDDALARLLGGIKTPGPEKIKLQMSGKKSHLLAMLNQKPVSEPIASTSQTTDKSHQARLLSMISPQPVPSSPLHSTTSMTENETSHSYDPKSRAGSSHYSSKSETNKHGSKSMADDAARQARAKALLESTVAGLENIGLGSSPAAENTRQESSQESSSAIGQGYGQSQTRQTQGQGQNWQRTPPSGQLPKQQQQLQAPVAVSQGAQPPQSQSQSLYDQQQNNTYRSASYGQARPPNLQAIGSSSGALMGHNVNGPAVYGSSPRTNQPPPPYDTVYREGHVAPQGTLPQTQYPLLKQSFPPQQIGNAHPPPSNMNMGNMGTLPGLPIRPPIVSAPNMGSYRPAPQPLPQTGYAHMPQLSHGPFGGLGSDGGSYYPQGHGFPGTTSGPVSGLGSSQVPAPNMSMHQPLSGTAVGQGNFHPAQGYQRPPPSTSGQFGYQSQSQSHPHHLPHPPHPTHMSHQPPQQIAPLSQGQNLPHNSAHYPPQPQMQHNQQQRTSPIKPQLGGMQNVHHPMPRQAGQAGLLAMLNGDRQCR